MCRQLFCLVALAGVLCAPSPGLADLTPVLGTAKDYAVLGASTVTNTGPTTITGDVGLYPGPSIVGFSTANTLVQGSASTGLIAGPGLVTGTIHIADTNANWLGNAEQAQVDLTNAYNALEPLGLAANDTLNDLTGVDLGTRNTSNAGALSPGVYHFDTSVGITGTLQLDAGGVNGVYWVFQIGSTLTTASTNSIVQFINPGSNNGSDVGVFWVVGSDATLNASTTFQGNILAYGSISILDSVTLLNGRALARTGAVTMINDTISNVCLDTYGNYIGPGFSGGLAFDDSGAVVPVPLPGALLLACSGMGSVLAFGRRFFSKS